jgi:hypothetical protein
MLVKNTQDSIVIVITMLLTSLSSRETIAQQAVRVSKSATIELNAKVEKVFPLFGPVQEKKWAKGWNPEIIFGNGDVELRMVFRTSSRFDDEKCYTWIVTQLEPTNSKIEYTVTSSERIWFVTVRCEPKGEMTLATITYSYIGLSQKDIQRNKESLEFIFAEDLVDWQQAINYYLSTG